MATEDRGFPSRYLPGSPGRLLLGLWELPTCSQLSTAVQGSLPALPVAALGGVPVSFGTAHFFSLLGMETSGLSAKLLFSLQYWPRLTTEASFPAASQPNLTLAVHCSGGTQSLCCAQILFWDPMVSILAWVNPIGLNTRHGAMTEISSTGLHTTPLGGPTTPAGHDPRMQLSFSSLKPVFSEYRLQLIHLATVHVGLTQIPC